MIKFFRKIRQQMIKENKVSKYVLYAIGEIVLVVIGILIALSINNWNSNRIEEVKENYVLKQLLTEFKTDSTKLNNLIAITSNKIAGIKRLKLDKKAKEQIPLPFIFFLGKAVPFYDYSPTYNELISSGTLGIIKNDSIKYAINDFINHNAMMENGLYDNLHNVKSNYMAHVYKFFDGEINGLIWDKENFLDDIKNLNKDLKGFFNDSETDYLLNAILAADSEINHIYKKNVKTKLSNVLRLIQNELKKQ